MKYKIIPGTDLYTSSICLGTALLGSTIDQENSFLLLDEFYNMGGNFLDTAHTYADWIPGERSRSEKTIGKWMKERGIREKIIIATKGGNPNFSSLNVGRLSHEEITSDLNESLEYLQTDYIDLYWLHRDDPTRSVSDILVTMNELVESKKVKYFACSNWKVHRIREAMEYSYVHGLKCFSANQMMWSLAEINMSALEDKTLVVMDQEGMEFHKKVGLAAIPYSSQANGFFIKMNHSGVHLLDENIKKLYYNEINENRLKKLKKLTLNSSASVTELALSYLISQPFVTIPIIGCKTMEQLTESLKAADLTLEPKIVNYLMQND